MEQLPFVVLERRARRMIGDSLPAAMPEAAMAVHLEILRRCLRRRRRVDNGTREALPFERHLRTAGDHAWCFDPDQLQQSWHEVAGVHELMPDFAARGDALRP